MSTTGEKIAEIEREIARTQKNKATNYHLGTLRAKLSKLRAELIAPPKSGGGPGEGFDVKSTGDARIGLIGFPSVGKSTLMSTLTGQESEVAAYEFTTLTCIPGEVQYNGARFQILDLPGIIEGAKDGHGRGRQVITVARTCDLILICLDALKPMVHRNKILHELEGFGIRLNKKRPNMTFTKKESGGINFTHTVPVTSLTKEVAKAICSEYKIHNANITLREDCSPDDLIDVIEGNRAYIPGIYVLNKIDQLIIEELEVLAQLENYVPISAHHKWNLDELLETAWEKLNMIRVYTKPHGQLPDYTAPVVVRDGCTVEQFCSRIHKTLVQDFKIAIVWGSSVKYSPMKCGKDHVLKDEDVITIVKK